MINYFEPVNFNQDVYTANRKGCVQRHVLRDLCQRHAATTKTPDGPAPCTHIRNGTELWMWADGGRSRRLVTQFRTCYEAEHALLLSWRWDLLNGGPNGAPQVFYTEAEARDHAKLILLDLADSIIWQAAGKGLCSIPGTDHWLWSSEHLSVERRFWQDTEGFAQIDLQASSLWLTDSTGTFKPVGNADDLMAYMRTTSEVWREQEY